MKLSDLRLPEETVQLPGGESFAVRGVSLQDTIALVRHHGPALSNLFNQITSGKDVRIDAMLSVATTLLEQAPEMVAELIALASGESTPEAVAGAARLPLPVQLDALEKIGKLTFFAEGGLGKFAETVIRVMQGTSGAINELQLPSPSKAGSASSGAK